MLAEVLLVLSGHPSSFFVSHPSSSSSIRSLTVSPKLEEYLHPGEVSVLNALADLARQSYNVRLWAHSIQRRGRAAMLNISAKGKQKEHVESVPNQYLSTLASSILDVLTEWDALIVELESRILSLDPEVVQDQAGHVPLSVLLAMVSPWQAPLGELSGLIKTVDSTRNITPGQLLQLVEDRSQTGNPRIRKILTTLSGALIRLFLAHLCAFILDGLTSTESNPVLPSLGLDRGPDPLSPKHRLYALNGELCPPSLSGSTKESILYIGRVTATLRSKNTALPKGTTKDLREVIMSVKSLEDGSLDKEISRTRSEVGEWLWRNVLTGGQVVQALRYFGDYFLTRNAELATGTIREIHALRLDKLITADPHSSSSVIREQDLRHALLKASVGTSAENDKALDNVRFRLERGPIRPLLTHLSPVKMRKVDANRKDPDSQKLYDDEDSTNDLFSSFLLGSPLTLEASISWPLDLFMTPKARETYTDIHSYLFALRDAHLRISDCWKSLSAAQRRRRKWTSTTEGGTRSEVRARLELARAAWGTVRIMLFFLDQLIGHFMTDIIEVQHQHLLDELESMTNGHQSMSRAVSTRGSMRASRSVRSISGSIAGSTIDHDTVWNKKTLTQGNTTEHLDFITLRAMHSRHLFFLRQGLLLADRSIAVVTRDILEICIRFTGLVERWEGDVVPELLLEGSDGEQVGQLVAERSEAIAEVNGELRDQILTLFHALLLTQNPNPTNANGEVSTITAGASMSRTARAAQIIQSSRMLVSRQMSFSKNANGLKAGAKAQASDRSSRSAEAEALMARHIEQCKQYFGSSLLPIH
ncbi:Spc98 family-domain-containing protein [Kockovaella imperatae]|uniref:Spindle pole body component n=1 Tax=Kockovaella imperatae TaxID=4999 RepID=A0A1Y1ULA9_9TREE|nr:Spc98 family-domain-containing protein [Kockovaella imperatae]ORX37895.1 Spc98 family-domain-containing protein [Kockovaella imperatae]